MEETAKKWAPEALGKQVEGMDHVDLIPWRGVRGGTVVTLEATEFTSLCPVTGQRDMANLRITYGPRDHIVETKSLKLWLANFANAKAFNEVLVDSIATYLFAELQPAHLAVEGTFNVRGGIIPSARAERFWEGEPKPARAAAPSKEPTLLGSSADD